MYIVKDVASYEEESFMIKDEFHKYAKNDIIAEINELLGEDMTTIFNEAEKQSAIDGEKFFLVRNSTNEVIAVQSEQKDTDSSEFVYIFKDDWLDQI